ncbi:aminopeptidase [Acuticoccus sediminis]|uniref:Aminopeptidase n=1 Tax=Acuticoccus sediminis TaxID=2184697 RepID=A0A8B2NLY1_9HYPH|nr:AbrB family transcriptional regulator [Acuticoccus sediminis]RAH98824.1 aminopeptidase [Acuticoccus sediminis]
MAFFTRARLVTFAVAAAGAAMFLLLGLPLPFLFGPMTACLVAALLGARLQRAGTLGTAARTVLGLAVGASITPEVVDRLPSMAASLALVPLYVLLIGAVGVPYFHRVAKFDLPTAYYSAMPGGMQDMIVFGEVAGANVRALSLVQATRVLTIVTVAPFLLINVYGVEFVNPVGAPAGDLPLSEILIMIAAALIGWKGGERIGLFGASIIGPMVLAAILSLTGLLHDRPPREAVLASQFLIGLSVGVYYVGVTLRELRHIVVVGAVFVLVLAALAAAFTEIVVLSGLAPAVEGFLAFAPGGQAEMAIIAIVAGADLGYVVTHHLARMVLVIVLAPIVAAMARIRPRRPDEEGP